MNSIDSRALAAHVLVALAHAHGRAVNLDDLAEAVGVRKTDVRAVVTRLGQEGHVDALRLRLTLSGLAIAASLDGCKLPSLRPAATHVRAVCAA